MNWVLAFVAALVAALVNGTFWIVLSGLLGDASWALEVGNWLGFPVGGGVFLVVLLVLNRRRDERRHDTTLVDGGLDREIL